MVAGSFIVPPYTAGKVLDETTKDRREAANLGILKTALQDSVNRTARQTTAATVAGSDIRNKRTLNIPLNLSSAGVNEMLGGRSERDKEFKLAQILASQQAGLLSGAKRGSRAGTLPGQEYAPMSVAEEASRPQVPTEPLDVLSAIAAKEVKAGRERTEAFRTRPLEGVDVPMGPKDVKTKVTTSTKSRVPSAGEVRSGVGVRGRGAPPVPAKPKAGAKAGAAGTPEQAERLAIQRFAASLGIKKEQVKVISRTKLGDEGAELIVDIGGGGPGDKVIKHRLLID